MKTKISSLNHLFFFSLFSILLHAISVQSQSSTSPLSTSSVLMSDVIHDVFQPQLILSFKQSVPETCKETYGFLPCTNTVLGNLFLIFGYGYFMFLAARYLSTGSELLLEILGPGLVGGLFLPIISVLPEALLILVSGLSGSKETAETQVLVGMGMLAGSAIILLTLLWGSCVAVGKTDIDGSTTIDKHDTKGFSSTGSGISVDIWTSYCARIMILSVIPFIIVQLPQILTLSYGRRQAVLISLIVTVVFLISYCLYQVFQPWMQQRKLAYVRHKHVISGILGHIKERAHGKLLSDDGEPNDDIIRKVFTAIDLNEDGLLAKSEIRAFLIGLRIEEVDLEHDDSAGIMLRDFNTSGTGYIDVTEFVKGISKWLNEARRSVTPSLDRGPDGMTFIDRFHEQAKHEYNLLRGDQSAEIVEGTENSKWVTTKAILFLFLGVVIAAAFADPLVNTVKNFSTGTSIPSFFVSFIALPLVTNSSECVSALISASQKKKRTSSLTYSEIYGSVTIHNLLCLTVFLAIVYVRDLKWNFSAEVLIIVIVCIVMGLFASFRTIFPLWTTSVAYALYPFSLLLVYVLDYVCGWS